MTIKWPKGKDTAKLRKACAEIDPNCNIVVIDPSSGGTSLPGYCYSRDAKMLDSGTIPLPKRTSIEVRLRALYDYLDLNFKDADVLVIELVRGNMAHEYLRWAIGVTMTGCRAPRVIMMPIPAWKAYAKTVDTYAKGDEADAIIMWETLMTLIEEEQ